MNIKTLMGMSSYFLSTLPLFVICFVTSRLQWNPIAPSKWQNTCSKIKVIIIITLMTDLG